MHDVQSAQVIKSDVDDLLEEEEEEKNIDKITVLREHYYIQ